jgi:NTE family protein
MGGAVGLLYARFGRARPATEAARDLAGSKERLVDVTWLPRSSLLAGKKHFAAIAGFYGEAQIAELVKPAAAVAADLVRGERFVMEQGPAATAARATTAIPGIFPPVSWKGRLLVDGGLVSRVPVDLLFRRRCGLKLAVTPIPMVAGPAPDAIVHHRELERRFRGLLGFRSIIACSWRVLGTWQSALEAQGADVLVEPRVPVGSSVEFDSFEEMVAAGRRAAEEKLDMIRSSVASLLKPGTLNSRNGGGRSLGGE